MAVCVGSDDYVYLGVGTYLIKWDGSQYTIAADLGTNYIYRLGADDSGNIYGIAGVKDFSTQKRVFKFDGTSVSYLTSTEAAYMHNDTEDEAGTEVEDGQWKGFSVDTANSVVWYLYDTGTVYGIAKVPFTGGAATYYSRSADSSREMDFVDCGTTIEFFYAVTGGGYSYI